MRILFVSHYFESHGGGIELVVGHLAREMVKRGIEVRWSATGERASLPEELTGVRRIPMHSFNAVEQLTGFPYPIWTPTTYPALLRAIRSTDVVHIHDAVYFGSQLAAWFARREGKRVVVTQHIGQIPFTNPAFRVAQKIANAVFGRRLLEKSDRVVFVSDFVRREYSGLRFKAEPATIHNGVDLELFNPGSEPRDSIRARLGIDASVPVFLFVGRFSPKKGLPRIREAAKILPDVQWILVGSGGEDPSRWRLPNVLSPGRQAQAALPDWYRAADLLVLPSVGEGFPLVVQESMACGTPCLVSEETRGGCDPARDFIFSAGAGARDFLNAASGLAEDAVRLTGLRGSVAEFARGWSWSGCAESYLQAYREASGTARA